MRRCSRVQSSANQNQPVSSALYKKFGNLDSGQYTIIKSKQEEHADS